MIDFIKGNWLDILLVIVGLLAFLVYFFQKWDAKRSAASLVLGQIDLVENRVLTLKAHHNLNNVIVYNSKTIINDNAWEKYKHLFAKELSTAENKIVQDFFDHAEQLERIREDIVKTVNNAWADKSTINHQIVAELIKESLSDKDKSKVATQIDEFQMNFNPLELVFTPDMVKDAILKSLGEFKVLSGTTAYAKLQKYSYTK